ncbi:MAG: type II secretion system protein [Verrucomicrobiota bacterium JB024]|nr:type II secretion system protein [Verrucomicrobiota bacterium JB024]
MRNRSASPRRAFTLVELLAVIGIIAVMATVIGVSLTGGNATASLGTSQRVGASIFQSARSIAVLKQTPTRVLIYSNNGADTDSGKSLRFMQVVYQNPDSQAEQWIAANTGTYLPQGVYFIPGNINTYILNGAGNNELDASGYSDGYDNGNVTVYPNEDAANDNRGDITFPAYYYEFDSNGLSDNPGAKIVFGAGRVAAPPANGIPQLAFENRLAVMGFYLRRLGNVSLAEYDNLTTAPTN